MQLVALQNFFEKASACRFQGSTAQALDARANDGSILFERQGFPTEPRINEQNNTKKEESDMNEWERLGRAGRSEQFDDISQPLFAQRMFTFLGNVFPALFIDAGL